MWSPLKASNSFFDTRENVPAASPIHSDLRSGTSTPGAFTRTPCQTTNPGALQPLFSETENSAPENNLRNTFLTYHGLHSDRSLKENVAKFNALRNTGINNEAAAGWVWARLRNMAPIAAHGGGNSPADVQQTQAGSASHGALNPHFQGPGPAPLDNGSPFFSIQLANAAAPETERGRAAGKHAQLDPTGFFSSIILSPDQRWPDPGSKIAVQYKDLAVEARVQTDIGATALRAAMKAAFRIDLTATHISNWSYGDRGRVIRYGAKVADFFEKYGLMHFGEARTHFDFPRGFRYHPRIMQEGFERYRDKHPDAVIPQRGNRSETGLIPKDGSGLDWPIYTMNSGFDNQPESLPGITPISPPDIQSPPHRARFLLYHFMHPDTALKDNVKGYNKLHGTEVRGDEALFWSYNAACRHPPINSVRLHPSQWGKVAPPASSQQINPKLIDELTNEIARQTAGTAWPTVSATLESNFSSPLDEQATSPGLAQMPTERPSTTNVLPSLSLDLFDFVEELYR